MKKNKKNPIWGNFRVSKFTTASIVFATLSPSTPFTLQINAKIRQSAFLSANLVFYLMHGQIWNFYTILSMKILVCLFTSGLQIQASALLPGSAFTNPQSFLENTLKFEVTNQALARKIRCHMYTHYICNQSTDLFVER